MTKKLIQIRFHGRGGQGTVTLAELVALAGFYMGYETQSFPSFGVERRGAPVLAFARIFDQPIRLREQIYEPDFLIIQDKTLLGVDSSIEKGLSKTKMVIVNMENNDSAIFKNLKVINIPATEMALRIIGKPFVNTILLGAFGSASGLLSLESMQKAITEKIKREVVDLNLRAMEEAYNFAKNKI
ncbi:MAG: 2-oxoacid:acceptor oxidoreductase family protein [Patescibacteria group bacterium]